MSHAINAGQAGVPTAGRVSIVGSRPAYWAYQILHIG
jgi:hypothetical protein